MTTQVAVSNENIGESVAAWQPLCIPSGGNRGFVTNENQEPKTLSVIRSAATVPEYCCEPLDANDSEFGGELARF
jgi:hypothetical protein